jgi:hypothetical protein
MPGSTTSRPRSSTRGKELGETIEALSTKADVKGRVKKKAADTKDSITETVYETKEIALEKAHAAQSAARDAITDDTGSVKPRVPIAALSAAAVRSALWCGAAAGEPAPASTHRNQRTHGARSVGHLSCGAVPTESTSRDARRPADRSDRQSAFLLGYFTTRLLERLPLSSYRRPLLGTGLRGGLTTFSTMQVENHQDARTPPSLRPRDRLDRRQYLRRLGRGVPRHELVRRVRVRQ